MSSTPAKQRRGTEPNEELYKTPPKTPGGRPRRTRTPSLKAVENLQNAGIDSLDSADNKKTKLRKSARKVSPNKRYLGEYEASHTPKKDTSAGDGGGACEARMTRRLKSTIDIEQVMLLETITVTSNDEEVLEEDNNPLDMGAESVVRRPTARELDLIHEKNEVAGKNMFGFNTPKKRNSMAMAAANTVKTPKTSKTPGREAKTPGREVKTPRNESKVSPREFKTPSKTPKRDASKTPGREAKTPAKEQRTPARKPIASEPKTPSHVRRRLKTQIAKLVEEISEEDFSADSSEYEPSSPSCSDSSNSGAESSDDAGDDEPKTPLKRRRPIVVPVLPKTPSAVRLRQSARIKKSTDYVPESGGYFQAHANAKILTSNHTLDRLKNPRLPADRIFSLLEQMKISNEHESAINAMMEEYRSYFTKWLYILNEGFNILLYGLGSKRQLLQSFHREFLGQQTVLVVNGFFPSLTIKDILDSITGDILDAGISPGNAHEAVDVIEEEFALIPETHLYLIVHNLDGTMLRNAKAQAIIARLAKVPNIHLLASVDHINTPLLWDSTKLSQFNFSWWDCTTMLPYTDETAYENSLLVQNSGELALSSMRSVFSSLTTNGRGIYLILVKYQLANKANPTFQGMSFKELYTSCREAFLVSSDLALRAQLTEFLDHKLVKSKRNVDGTELLQIPIDGSLLQQFLEEQDKK